MEPKNMIKLLKQHVSSNNSYIKLKNTKANKMIIVPYHTKDLPKGTPNFKTCWFEVTSLERLIL